MRMPSRESGGGADGTSSGPGPPFPGLAAFRIALRSLTILGWRLVPSGIGGSALYYPVVGLLLGALWVGTDRAAALVVDRLLTSVLVLLVATGATGAGPLMALGRTIAARLTTTDREGALRVLEGTPTRAVYASLLLVVGLELACLYELDHFRLSGLLLTPMLGRCGMVVLAVGSRAARADGRRVKFAPALTFREFALASTMTFAIVLVVNEYLGLVLVMCTAALTVGLRVVFHRWLGGINDATIGATCEATQLTALAVLALF